MKNKFLLYSILGIISSSFFSFAYSQNNINMALGNPSHAVADTTVSENYLIEKLQYCLSYNNTKHLPNWGELACRFYRFWKKRSSK